LTDSLQRPARISKEESNGQEIVNGQWYWVTTEDYRGKKVRWLGCVTHLVLCLGTALMSILVYQRYVGIVDWQLQGGGWCIAFTAENVIVLLLLASNIGYQKELKHKSEIAS